MPSPARNRIEWRFPISDLTEVDREALQRRTVRVLVTGQILGGIGFGASMSIGSVLATEVSGTEAFAGAAATLGTLGAAAAAVPLARLAQQRGRRVSLATGTLVATTGAALTVVATGIASFPLLLLALGLLGVGSAVNLQSRFAATDVADPAKRGRDLSIVVWSATVGAVVGPNLFAPGEVIGEALQMPRLTGSFVFAVLGLLAASIVYAVALRPDPYLVALSLPTPPSAEVLEGAVRARRLVIFAMTVLAVSHAVMVSIMSMTPVHLVHHGVSLAAVGFTLSLHIAGMFALSPVFGWLSDRLGRFPTILIGQALFAASIVVVAFGELNQVWVTVGLALLGLGWSASTVSASALLADLVTGAARTKVQGRSDLVMNVAGASGGAIAGPVLAVVGYAGLAWAAGVLVVAIAVGAFFIGPRASKVEAEATRAT